MEKLLLNHLMAILAYRQKSSQKNPLPKYIGQGIA